MSDNEPKSENDSEYPDLSEDGVELSLDELGRAYARASGLVPDEPQVPDEPAAQSTDENAACELSPRSILEAILFVGSPEPGEPLTTRKIASWIRGVSPIEVMQLARELQQEYEQSGSAFRVERDKNQVRLVLAEEYDIVRQSFYGEARKARLSQQAVDVLAIVAYNQPVKRELVNELRGRDCGAILNQLVKRNLLTTESENPKSKVKVYRTTDRFLDLFGLDSVEDLPQSEDIAPSE